VAAVVNSMYAPQHNAIRNIDLWRIMEFPNSKQGNDYHPLEVMGLIGRMGHMGLMKRRPSKTLGEDT
jgi:hypothetical protein